MGYKTGPCGVGDIAGTMLGAGYAATRCESALSGNRLDMPFGPHAAQFLLLMSAVGLLCSWLGTLCWNEASQRLPPALGGQLIIFETLAALGHGFALRGHLPRRETLLGVALLSAGVVWAVGMQSVRARS